MNRACLAEGFVRYDRFSRGTRGAVLVLGLAVIAATVGCDGSGRYIPPGPTGQPVLAWMNPIDRDALLTAMASHRTANLSAYNFELMIVVQNFLNSGFAVTFEVNGQDIERRRVGGLTQEIFTVPDSLILQTEAALGFSSANVDARLAGRLCPFVVRLKDYVTEDGYVIPDSAFVLAPKDAFENMVFHSGEDEDSKYLVKGSYFADAIHVCPGSFAIAVHKTHIDFVELDREFIPVNEPQATTDDTSDIGTTDTGDNTDAFFKRFYEGLSFHLETVKALDQLKLLWLLPFLHQPPVVKITGPAEGTAVDTGATVTITAEAYDPDGTVTLVEFFAGSVKIGESTTPPYTVSWTVEGTGEYKLTAKATDNDSKKTVSEAVTLLVGLGPVLRVSPQALSFGPGETVATVRVTNGGTGALVISNVHPVKPWISVNPTSGGQGLYTITVNRAGLPAGPSYNGTVIFVSNGGNVELPIAMEN